MPNINFENIANKSCVKYISFLFEVKLQLIKKKFSYKSENK